MTNCMQMTWVTHISPIFTVSGPGGGHVATKLAAAAAATADAGRGCWGGGSDHAVAGRGCGGGSYSAVAPAADACETEQMCNVNACRTWQGCNQGRKFFLFSSPTEVPLACSYAVSSFLG